jgi:hypothetical protein
VAVKSLRELYSLDRVRETPKAKAQSGPYKSYFEYYQNEPSGLACGLMATHSGYICTRPEGHNGPHAAPKKYGTWDWCFPWDDNGKAYTMETIPKCTENCTLPLGHKGEHLAAVVWKKFPDSGLPFKTGIKGQYEKAKGMNYCTAAAPAAGLICTRELGHTGEHEAHYSDDACAPPWSDGIEYKTD